MAIWYTWLGFFGVIAGLAASAAAGTAPLRSSLIGLAAALVLVIAWNAVAAPPSCLQNSKGWDILRAYSLDCAK